jgi:UDP-3-O-[3-hydroxymyristoyl] glucosamine N-acyltransferase
MNWKFYLSEMVSVIKSEGVIGQSCADVIRIATLNDAGPGDLSFCRNKNHLVALQNASASIVLIPNNIKLFPKEEQVFLICNNPSYSLGLLCAKVEEILCQNSANGIDKTAVVHELVRLGKSLSIGPKVVIEEGTKIDDNVIIGAGTFIGRNVKIGKNTVLAPMLLSLLIQSLVEML